MPKTKKVSHIVRGVLATGYFGPRRRDYKKEEDYLKAISMNGKGKLTSSGTEPRVGTISADPSFYPRGKEAFIPEINFWVKFEDTGSRIKGKKRIDIFCGHGKNAERIANTWGPGTPITLIVMR